MNKKSDKEEPKKEYTGASLIDETMKILKKDSIGKNLSENQLRNLSKLLAQTAVKGDL